MIQIVCIAEGTHRENINEIGDIVSMHESDVDLTGIAYSTFEVIEIDMTMEEFRLELENLPYEI